MTSDALFVRDSFFADGEWVPPATTNTLDILSPHTEEPLGIIPAAIAHDIDTAVSAARRAFDAGPWPRMRPSERGMYLARLSDLFEESADDIARVIATDVGSPLTFARADQAEPVRMLRYFSGLAETYPWSQHRASPLGSVGVYAEPAGVVAAITPWNVPLWTFMIKAAPALAAGCTLVVKPAIEAPLATFMLADLIAEAGIPRGVVNIVPGDADLGSHLANHRDVDMVTFSGSPAGGRRVAETAGRRLKRCVLELGGKNPAIILDDADLDAIIPDLKHASLFNNGQACAAMSRILVPASRYPEMIDALSMMVDGLTVGDPTDPATDVGPLVSRQHRDRVAAAKQAGVNEGANPIVGGPAAPVPNRGWYVAPTLFTAWPNMAIARNEIFGPVLCVMSYRDDDEAVAMANDSYYGLAASVWTGSPARGRRMARRLRCGTVGINTFRIDPEAPFGGPRDSGNGSRELGPEGLREFLEPQTIVE